MSILKFLLLISLLAYGVTSLGRRIIYNSICQGKCAHGDKHCQQMCLDRGFCPRERE